MSFWSYSTNGLHSSVIISGRLLVAPGSVPLHLTPGVTNTNQLDLWSSVVDLRRQDVRDNKEKIKSESENKKRWICCGYLLHSSDGVSVAFNQTSSGLCFRFSRTCDLMIRKHKHMGFRNGKIWYWPHFESNKALLTSMEHPSIDPLSTAFLRMRKRFVGAFFVSYISPTPPVKSSIASMVLPPFRDS